MRNLVLALIALILFHAAPAAKAQDLAVVISNVNYRNLPVRHDHGIVRELAPNLRRAGFNVIELRDLQSGRSDRDLREIGERIEQADRVVVVLSGHFATLGEHSYLVSTTAADRDLFNIGQHGLALDSFLSLLRAKQGSALLAIASSGLNPDVGWQLERGYRLSDVPQGVTVVAGTPGRVTDFLPELLVSDRSIADAADLAPSGLRVLGYVPGSHAFIETDNGGFVAPSREERDWNLASSRNTVDSYNRYLLVYPNGRYADEARSRIEDLSLTPEDRARLAEEALNLNRDRRARLQQYLTILGFDTRGVDGVFGPRSRAAIGSWQSSIGAVSTGYLSANQVARIEQDGAIRAEELRRQEEQRRLEEEARDRAYWQQTGVNGTEEGYLAYLQRYPNGLFAEEANRRLKQIEREKRRQARIEERLAWDDAVMAGTIQSYQAYLNAYPDGSFSAEAQARIDTLAGPAIPPNLQQQAEAEENNLRLDPFRKRLIEQQLRNLGFDPGQVDGNFTNQTRRAIAQYQQRSNTQATGYVTGDLLVLLLVSAIGR